MKNAWTALYNLRDEMPKWIADGEAKILWHMESMFHPLRQDYAGFSADRLPDQQSRRRHFSVSKQQLLRTCKLPKHPITDEGSAEKRSLTFYIGLSAVHHLNCAQVLYYCTMRYWHMRSRRLIRSVCRSIGPHTALSQWVLFVDIIAKVSGKILNKV